MICLRSGRGRWNVVRVRGVGRESLTLRASLPEVGLRGQRRVFFGGGIVE